MKIIKWYKDILKKSGKIGFDAGAYAGFKLKQNIENIQLFIDLVFDFVSLSSVLFVVYFVLFKQFNIYIFLICVHIIIVLINTIARRIKKS